MYLPTKHVVAVVRGSSGGGGLESDPIYSSD